MLKFYPRCQNLEENLIKIPSIPFSRHIFSLLENVVIVTMKSSLPIPLASHIDRRGYSRFTALYISALRITHGSGAPLAFHRPCFTAPWFYLEIFSQKFGNYRNSFQLPLKFEFFHAVSL